MAGQCGHEEHDTVNKRRICEGKDPLPNRLDAAIAAYSWD